MFKNLLSRWSGLSLTWQFALTASTLMLAGMLVMGIWVADRIRSGVVENTAAASVAHINSHLATLVRELATSSALDAATEVKLAAAQRTIIDKVASIKIWRADGTIIYSTWHDMIGRQFPLTNGLKAAFAGEIAAQMDGEAHEGDEHDEELRGAVIEIYAPVRDENGEIIAVAEYYSRQPRLGEDLLQATMSSWLVVGSITLVMITTLFGIVRGGSRVIDTQRLSLQLQIAELTRLLQQNDELKASVQRAHRRSAQINERVLRKLGSELHDGPAQLLSLALLLIDNLRAPAGSSSNDSKVDHIRGVLVDALGEVRAISAGLGMPDLEKLGLEEVARSAAQMHSVRTGTHVGFDLAIDDATRGIDQPLKVCIYRLIQEGLNNSFRHANGNGQKVSVSAANGTVRISVSDEGPGLRDSGTQGNTHGLGLLGLRDRVETLGGRLDMASTDRGCQLTATFNLKADQATSSHL